MHQRQKQGKQKMKPQDTFDPVNMEVPESVDGGAADQDDDDMDWLKPFDDGDEEEKMDDRGTSIWDQFMSIGQASARKCMKKALNNGAEFVALSLTIDDSNRERFMKNPALYMAAETKNAEVSYGKLRSEERPLFDEAMTRELTEFLKSEACRRCESAEELAEARESG